MHLTTTPHVREYLRGDDLMDHVVQRLGREDRPGYLHLSRPTRHSLFVAIYWDANGDRHEARSLELDAAILRAMASQVAA